MADALQILREDHRKVKDIFRQFEDAEDRRTKKSLVDQALLELTVHTQLEEEFFYPAVRREGDTADMMDEAEEEHHVAEMLIDELRGMTSSDERYDAKFKVLAESVKHHIEEEEANALPKAAELGPSALMRIGQQMEMRRPALIQQAQTMRTRTTSARGRTRSTSSSRSGAGPRRTARSGSGRSSTSRRRTTRTTTTPRSSTSRGRTTAARTTRGSTRSSRTSSARATSRSRTTSRSGRSSASRTGMRAASSRRAGSSMRKGTAGSASGRRRGTSGRTKSSSR